MSTATQQGDTPIAYERMEDKMRELGYSEYQISRAYVNHFNTMLDYIDRHGNKRNPIRPADMVQAWHDDGKLQSKVGQPQNL